MAAEDIAVEENAAFWPAWPEYGLVDDLLPVLSDWAARGRRIALATIVDITGSSPRPMGSEMAVADDGSVAGYVSGGCVEAAVAAEGLAALADGRARLLDYGDGSPLLDVQLSCGGRIGILVRPIADPRQYVTTLLTARAERSVVSVVTDLASGAMRIVKGAEWPSAGFFVRPHEPPVRLVAVGADPVTLSLMKLAPEFGIQPCLIRPMGPEAPPTGFTLMHYDRRRLDRALADLALDRWSAVYSLMHDSESDLSVVRHALASPAFCVGILGSRRKIADRLRQLQRDGITGEALRRLHLPAGLSIGARGPSEIALAILAQIITQRPPALAAGAGSPGAVSDTYGNDRVSF